MSMKPPDPWVIYWICWMVIGFGVAEFIAIKQNMGGTFSHTFWWAANIGGTDKTDFFQWVFRIVVAVGLVWVAHHFYTRGNFFQ